MIRVLHVIGRMDRGGGAEALLMAYYRAIDREKIQFDFVIHAGTCTYGDEIRALGGKIYRAADNKILNIINYIKWWREFFVEHPEYRIIHGHILTSAAIYLREAKKQGCYTIAHSHNTKAVGERISYWLPRKITIYPVRYIADSFLACSKQAGIDRFGKNVIHSGRFQIIMNAICCEKYMFSESAREKIRNELKIDTALLIGHVGRFTPQKNHLRLLEIFAKIHEMNKETRLLLLGGGELEQRIHKRCTELRIDDAVIFAGVQSDIEDYYSSMDIFLFPSLHEGLGNAVVEAQTSGLPCVVSDAVPEIANIGAGLFNVCSLKETNQVWADMVLRQYAQPCREKAIEYTRRAGYDVNTQARKLEIYYSRIRDKR